MKTFLENPEQQPQIIPPIQQEPPEPPKTSWLHNKLFGYGFLAIVFFLIVGGVYAWQYGGTIDNFEECFEEVYGLHAILVEKCQTPDGQVFLNPDWPNDLFADDPTFRAYWNCLDRLFIGSIVLSTGF